MIKSFADERTAAIFKGIFHRSIPVDIRRRAFTKLHMIAAAEVIEDLRAPPSNKLEKKKGDLQGRWAIWINDQWRFVFLWTEDGAADVQFTDYHN